MLAKRPLSHPHERQPSLMLPAMHASQTNAAQNHECLVPPFPLVISCTSCFRLDILSTRLTGSTAASSAEASLRPPDEETDQGQDDEEDDDDQEDDDVALHLDGCSLLEWVRLC